MGFLSESLNSVMNFVTSFQICNFSESIYIFSDEIGDKFDDTFCDIDGH